MKEKVCVFGVGSYYSAKKSILVEKYEIREFIDNRLPEGMTDICDGKTVFNPKDYLSKKKDMSIVLMAADWYGMWSQLKEYRVLDERIILTYDMQPFYDRTEEALSNHSVRISLKDNAIVITEKGKERVVISEENLKEYLRELYYRTDPFIKSVIDMPLKPSSTRFGLERGKPIDRVFIERFIEENKDIIRGVVVEIGDDRYMTKYSKNIDEPIIMHVNGWGGMKGNLATGEGIVDDFADCVICTQTLQHIYDIHSCIKNIYRILKPGGTALITNGCITELSLFDYHNWGEYWKFTDMAAKELFLEYFDEGNVKVISYGNAKAAVAFLYGISAEEMPEDTFEYFDEQFPVVVSVCACK